MLTKYCKILQFALLFAPNKFNRQDEMATAFNPLKDFALPLQQFQEKQEKQFFLKICTVAPTTGATLCEEKFKFVCQWKLHKIGFILHLKGLVIANNWDIYWLSELQRCWKDFGPKTLYLFKGVHVYVKAAAVVLSIEDR